MDLNDFRHQWQQQAAATPKPDLTHQKLQAMLANQPDSPVSEMLRNVRRDQRLIFLVVILNVGNVTNLIQRHTHDSRLLLDVVVALMILLASWRVYRQRQLIRALQGGNGSTHEHLRESIRQLRVLIASRFYTVVVFLVAVLLLLTYDKYDAIVGSAGSGLSLGLTATGLLSGLLLVGGLLMLSRRRQQRRYGRHLDRLEEALRELS